jgi:hypothetical protein
VTILWSLSVEEQFYLLWPAFVRSVGRRSLLVTSLALVALAPLAVLDDRAELDLLDPDLRRWFAYVRVDSPEWFQVTHGYDVLLASSTNRRLVVHLEKLRGWTRIYRGADGIVVVRAKGASPSA